MRRWQCLRTQKQDGTGESGGGSPGLLSTRIPAGGQRWRARRRRRRTSPRLGDCRRAPAQELEPLRARRSREVRRGRRRRPPRRRARPPRACASGRCVVGASAARRRGTASLARRRATRASSKRTAACGAQLQLRRLVVEEDGAFRRRRQLRRIGDGGSAGAAMRRRRVGAGVRAKPSRAAAANPPRRTKVGVRNPACVRDRARNRRSRRIDHACAKTAFRRAATAAREYLRGREGGRRRPPAHGCAFSFWWVRARDRRRWAPT